MGIMVDLILIVIILLNVLLGYKKGLIKVAFSIFAFLIALITTLLLVKPVSYLIIKNTTLDENIKSIIIKNNTFNNENKINEDSENNEIDEKDTEDNNTFIKKYIYGTITEKTNEAKNKAVETIADTIAIKVVNILTSIVLFIVIRIIIIFLGFLSDMISQIPVIKQFNEVGGIIYGLLKAVIIIYAILTIVFIFNSIKGSGFLGDAIEESYITKYLYNNNIIVNYCLLDKSLL